MPAISKIRFTNVVYEDGMKRYNDELFKFDGYNSAILLENGGGKTVYIQTALQAMIPHTNLADRKIKDTLQLDSYPAHIAIEWLISEQPRRYLVTAVSLFLTKNGLDSYRYVYDYEPGNKHNIEAMPFVKSEQNRPSDRGEISEYYQYMTQQSFNAKTFQTIKAYQTYIEDQYHIVANEWESIVKINSTEGGVEAFFDECKQTNQLLDRLLIPTIENAISGHDQHTFADTFEKHRESFKLYKELKEQIEENKSIEEELERYVETFERLHASEQTYEAAKQKAKGLLQLIQIQEQEQASALTHIQGRHQQWEDDSSAHAMDQVSLIIQDETSRLNELDILYQDAEQLLEEAKEALEASRYRYYSLKLAALKQTFEEEASNINYYQTELEKVDAEVDVTELKDQMDENSEALMGYFSHEIEESVKREQAIDIEIASLSEQISELGKGLNDKKGQLKQADSSLNSIKGRLAALEEEKKRIRTQVLANPEQETIEEQLPTWKVRHSFLDEEMVSLTNENKRLTKSIQTNREKMIEMEDNKEEVTRSLVQAEAVLEQLDKAHNQLKEMLAARRPQWTHLESVYLKQESIEQYLTETLKRLGRLKDDFMQHERLAHRLLDDHGEQDLFFADPVLGKHIHAWSNQFNLLETGVQYIQGLDYSLEEVNKIYPLWPQVLITTVQEKRALVHKVKQISDRIQIPIDVLSTEDVRSIIQDQTMPRESIVPEHWLSNQDQNQFIHWKQHLKEQAEEAIKARVDKEQVIHQWQQAQHHFYNFIKDYPYQHYQEQREQVLQLQEQLQTLKIKLRKMEQDNTKHQEKIEVNLTRIEDYMSEYHGLENKLEKSLRYMECVKETSNLSGDMEYYQKQKDQVDRLIARQEHKRERLKEEKENRNKEKDWVKWDRKQLLDDDIYLEVKNYQPKYMDDTKNVLIMQRTDLKMQLQQLSKSRGEIEAKLDSARKNKDNVAKSMKELRREEGQLNEALVFPANGDLQMDELLKQIETWQAKEKDSSIKRENAKTNRDKQEQTVENKLNDFAKAFPDQQPVEFNETTADVKERLYEEAKQLNEQKKYLDQEESRIQAELESIKVAFNQLDRFEEAHHFKGPSVTATESTQNDINTFSYNRLPFTKTVTESLTDHRKKLNQKWDKVNDAKEYFKLFCKNRVTNVKMREMVIQGVDRKQSYHEVIEFQSHMKKRVQHAIRYAEESIMTHDQELEQFITHMHSHLRTITQELAMIPKKTKVKVEEKWKHIYKFSIPEWTEEDGKERLRHHIEWIVEQLDKDGYRHAEGHEDYGKVRNDIETWLHSKQLIRIVMNNEMIKVTCRKVTNDNQVTTRSYSWEQSNVWSGGEKWSKNMTLFLGILNYVAEKQKHIQTNMKRHRAVILDNPFGKASSDHVLNPVFFIAEQLGFQIIALTAHAEGKFLRDYFPVIYSCRLRPAQDPTKQIMTKEKQLHHAYFQDHDPQSLERLGEVEQIELF